MTPLKVRGFGVKKKIKGAPKNEKTNILKNGPSYILPKIRYVISEPHGDLLHWNLSWASTFNFSAHEERGEQLAFSVSNQVIKIQIHPLPLPTFDTFEWDFLKNKIHLIT